MDVGKGVLALLICLPAAACTRSTIVSRSAVLPHVPVYPGAELVDSDVAPERDPTEYYHIRDASAPTVLAWYKAEMPKAGWTPTTDASEDFVIYHTPEGCYGFVAAYESAQGGVDLQLSEQAQGSPCIPYVTSEPGHD